MISTHTKTTVTPSEKTVKRSWHLIDVKGKVLGRVCPQIAQLLMGKHKSMYSSNIDTGDEVVVINAKSIVITGKKSQTKEYTRYSGYPGGLTKVSYKAMSEKHPERIIEHAVSGMLPKNKLRDVRMRRLHVFGDHTHDFVHKFVST